MVFLVHASFVNWAGHFSTGPRYLLPVLPLASLPFILLVSDITTFRSRIARPLAAGAVGIVLLLSTVQQFAVQRLPFFFQYRLFDSLQATGVTGALTCFGDTPTGHLALRLSQLRKDSGTFPLLAVLELAVGREDTAAYREILVQSLAPNFLPFEILAERQRSEE